jgi:hypothetical protein
MVAAALAPQWRLFDRVAPVPVLQVRAGPDATALGPWRTPGFQTPPADRCPAPWRLGMNAATTQRLAACSAVDRLADEAGRLPADVVASGLSLQVVRRLAVLDVVQRGDGPTFQLRIVLASPPDGDSASPPTAVSAVAVGAAAVADEDGARLLLCAPVDRIGADHLDAVVASPRRGPRPGRQGPGDG